MNIQEKAHLFISGIMSTLDLYCTYVLKVKENSTELKILNYEDMDFVCLDEVSIALGIFDPDAPDRNNIYLEMNINNDDYTFVREYSDSSYTFKIAIEHRRKQEKVNE